MVIGEAGYFFAYHSDSVAQQSRNWQARFRRMNYLRPCSVLPTRCWNRPRLDNGTKRTSGDVPVESAFGAKDIPTQRRDFRLPKTAIGIIPRTV